MPRNVFIEEFNTLWKGVPDDITDEEVRRRDMAGKKLKAEEAELSKMEESLSDSNLEEIYGRSNKDPNLEEIYGRSNKDPNLEERLSDPNLEEIYGRPNKDPNLEEIYGRPNKDPRGGALPIRSRLQQTGGEYLKSTQEAIEKPDDNALEEDILRVIINTTVAIPRFVHDVSSGVYEIGSDLLEERFRNPSKDLEKKKAEEEKPTFEGQAVTSLFRELGDFKRDWPFLSTTLTAAAPGFRDINPEDIIDPETGKIRPPETNTGFVLEIASYLTGSIGIYKTLPIAGALVKGAVAGITTDLLLGDPLRVNLGNIIQEASPDNYGKYAIVEYLSAEKDDPILLQKAKQAVSALAAEVLGYGFFKVGAWPLKKMREAGADTLASYFAANKGKVAKDVLKEVRQSLKVIDEKAVDTDEGFAQVIAMRGIPFDAKKPGGGHLDLGAYFRNIPERVSGLPARLKQRFGSSSGYLTPEGFAAKREAIGEKRAIISQATHIGNRLTLAINRIKDQAKGGDEANEILLNAQEALSQNMSDVFGYTGKGKNKVSQFDSWTPEERIKEVAEEFDMPENVAKEILKARSLIDNLSVTLTDSRSVTSATKKSIKANIGQYLTRSYKFFDDVDYTPSEEAKKKAIDFLVDSKLLPGKPSTHEEQAKTLLNKMIREKDEKVLESFYSGELSLKKGILKQKKDIPEPIREFLGEVKNPIENIMFTAHKLGTLASNMQFYDRLAHIGGGGRFGRGPNKYIFKTSNKAWKNSPENQKIFNTKIEGTGSTLDGRYTTPEMALAIRNMDAFVASSSFNISENLVTKTWAGLSGLSQKMLTVYSHQAQSRNFLGGLQFGLQNGWIPDLAGARNSQKILWNEIRKLGDEGFDTHYEKMQRLGVINTSVRAGEYRSLIKTWLGEEGVEGSGAIFKVPNKMKKGKVSTAVVQVPDDVYVAVDDFFKMNMFKRELKALKKIHPKETEDLLELEAAQIVRDNVPNYDYVPPAIRALRNWPLGSFVAFPSEVVRTTVNIVKRSSKEIQLGLTGNKPALRRGSERLAGLVTHHTGWAASGYGIAQLAGYTFGDLKAYNILLESRWSRTHNKIISADWVLDEESGEKVKKPKYLDTTFLNSGDTISAPFLNGFQIMQTGKLKGEALDAYLWDAMFKPDPSNPGAVLTLLRPYISEAVFAKSVGQILDAYRSDTGRATDGLKIFDTTDDLATKAGKATLHILQTAFVPGTARSILQVGEAIAGTPSASTGIRRDLGHETLAQPGIRFKYFDPAKELGRSVTEFLVDTRYNSESIKPNFRGSLEDFMEDITKREDKALEGSKDLYRKIRAFLSLGDYEEADVIKILMEKNISKDAALLMAFGKYSPRKDIANLDEILGRTFPKKNIPISAEMVGEYASFLEEHRNTYKEKTLFSREDWKEYMAPGLVPFLMGAEFDDDDDDDAADERDNFDKGGLVLDVPNVPKEPDERIDKVTGLPYNIQAGEAFIDNDDDPLKRIGFGKGGSVYEATKEKVGEGYRAFNKPSASKTMEYLADKGLGIDAKQLRQHEGEAAKIVNEALEKGIVNPDWVKKLEITKGGLLKGGQKVGDVFNAVNHALLSYKYNDRPGLLQAKEVVQGIFDEPEDSIQASLIDAWNNKAGFAIANRVKNKEGAKNEILRLLEQREDKLFKGEELIAGEDLFFAREEISVIRGLLK